MYHFVVSITPSHFRTYGRIAVGAIVALQVAVSRWRVKGMQCLLVCQVIRLCLWVVRSLNGRFREIARRISAVIGTSGDLRMVEYVATTSSRSLQDSATITSPAHKEGIQVIAVGTML